MRTLDMRPPDMHPPDMPILVENVRVNDLVALEMALRSLGGRDGEKWGRKKEEETNESSDGASSGVVIPETKP